MCTCADQYLNFESQHPLHHTLGVITAFYDQSDNRVAEEEDVKMEMDHVIEALGTCGYRTWTFRKVRQHEEQKLPSQRER